MNKRLFFVIFMSAIVSISLSAKTEEQDQKISSLTAEDIENIKKTTWAINIVTDVKDLNIEAIQFAIFETDPLPMLKASFDLRKKLNEGRTLTQFDKNIQNQVDWDIIFKNVTGDNVYLLKPKTTKNDSSMVSANTPNAKRWLVTKSALKKDGSFKCWIIPFNTKIGTVIDININDNNNFDIKKIK